MRKVAWVVVAAGCHTAAPGPDGAIVASNVGPNEMVTDGTYLYWTNFRGGILKTPLDAQDAPPMTVLDAGAAPNAQALAIDATSLYWTNAGDAFQSNGSFMKVALAGGTPMTLLSNTFGPPPNWMTTDATRIYFTNETAVWSISKAGGQLQQLASNETEAEEIVVTGSHLYWTDNALNTIRSLDLTNPSAVPVNFAPVMSPFHIATDGTNIYWNEFLGGGENRLMMAPIAGGDPVIMHKTPSPSGYVSGGVVTDGVNVYWSTDTAVMRIAVDGTGFKTLAANNQSITAMALGPTEVYWNSVEAIPNGSTTGIRETAK